MWDGHIKGYGAGGGPGYRVQGSDKIIGRVGSSIIGIGFEFRSYKDRDEVIITLDAGDANPLERKRWVWTAKRTAPGYGELKGGETNVKS